MANDCLQQIVEIIEKHYDIGKVKDVYEIFGGYINRSFGIIVQTDKGPKKYFFRKYKQAIALNEVKFEHALINHCIARGLTIAARVFANRKRKTYITPSDSPSVFALYEYLSGEDKYTWDNPALNDKEYSSSAKMLANFHNAARDFDPKGLHRKEAKILDLLPAFAVDLKQFARTAGKGLFDRYFVDCLEEILEVIEKTRFDTAEIAQMPLNPIHCDYHPGNLKFENNQVVGIFDFDWSKIDLRLFDVGLALAYFCTSWERNDDGRMHLDKCILFLTAYQEHLRRLRGAAPLNETELKNLPKMLTAASLYLINWIVATYYTDSGLDESEYLTYLKHTVRLLQWIDQHNENLVAMTSSLVL